MEIDTKSKMITLIPELSTSPAYTSGDQVGVLMTVPEAVAQSGGTGVITSVSVVDLQKRKMNFDLIFFDSAPTVNSTNNGALDIADADGAKRLGRLSITTWVDTNLNSDATLLPASAGLGIKAAAGSKDIKMILQSTANASGVYAASDLVINLFIMQD